MGSRTTLIWGSFRDELYKIATGIPSVLPQYHGLDRLYRLEQKLIPRVRAMPEEGLQKAIARYGPGSGYRGPAKLESRETLTGLLRDEAYKRRVATMPSIPVVEG